MIVLKGKNVNAKVFVNTVEEEALAQIQNMLNYDITENTQVRIMPDCHAGKGCTIGTTIRLPQDFNDWKVCPNIVGVDVGCGILMYKLADKNVNLMELDRMINEKIPCGFDIHNKAINKEYTSKLINCLTFKLKQENEARVHKSLGTLGGGNHFIEVGEDEAGAFWLSVHSGSRNLGVQVAKYHQEIAIKKSNTIDVIDRDAIIQNLKDEGRQAEIQNILAALKKEQEQNKIPDELAYLEGADLKNYLNDMALAQEYAIQSRHAMLDIIVEAMGLTVVDRFDSIHNFVEHNNFQNGMIRKGATSAKKGERLVIPLNMRDGSLICEGLGNEDWNCSAPHGAGRLMSRGKAKENLSMADFKAQMKDIYSSSVLEATLDEAPGAYKSAQEIINLIGDTVKIQCLVKPVYNFKAH